MAGVIAQSRAIVSSAKARILVTLISVLLFLTTSNELLLPLTMLDLAEEHCSDGDHTRRTDGVTGQPHYETKHQLSVPRIANPAVFDSSPIRKKRVSRRRGSAHAGQKSACGKSANKCCNQAIALIDPVARRSTNGPLEKIKYCRVARTRGKASPATRAPAAGQLGRVPSSIAFAAACAPRGILCRDLCRNPPIPARIGWCRALSLGYR
jgi:hypothetical protein